MKQSKLMSWVETCLNTGIGFGIAMLTQILVFPIFGYAPPLSTNFKIALIFTVVSIVRGYLLRRMFEFLHIRRPLSPFAQAVIAERYRQIEQEGWSLEHDDAHAAGELARAGGRRLCALEQWLRARLGPRGDLAVVCRLVEADRLPARPG